MTELLMPAVFGAVIAVAVLVAVAAARGNLPVVDFTAIGRSMETLAAPTLIATASAVVALIVTRWVVGAILAFATALFVPRLFGGQRVRAAAIARTESIAAWAEMLRDTLAGAAGLEETIAATAAVAPTPIRYEVRRLAARLEHEQLSSALTDFADELADPTADLVVSALVLASTSPTRNLGALLGTLAHSARAQAAMQLRIEAGRARTRSAVRIVTIFTIGFAVAMVVLNRGYLEPFDTPIGQLVLAAIGGCFAASFVMLDRMARAGAPARVLVRAGGSR